MTDAVPTAGKTRLQLGDAVAAIIVVDGSGYLLQLRDDLPHIWYPDHWGLFGGAVDPGEDEMAALRREVREELSLEFESARFVSGLEFSTGATGDRKWFRKFYEIQIASDKLAGLVLGEGAAMRVFRPEDVFGALRVTPYDAFALFLHFAERRLAG